MSDILVREAVESDAAAIAEIYAYYVRETAVTFDYEPPTAEEFREKISHIGKRYPFLLAEKDGAAAGFCYVSPFKAKAAYDWAVETTVYVKNGLSGRGAGTALYTALERILALQNVQNLNACITYPNPGSVSFHEKHGYRMAARFEKCGFKLGKWWDMIWMEKLTGSHEAPPAGFIPYNMLDKNDIWRCLNG